MTTKRIFIAIAALIGAVVGAAAGYFLAPSPHRYEASAKVALLPAANLTTAEASSFWEVLTRGQISRMAAVLYHDPRWLPAAANAAKVSQDELSVNAAAMPETTLVSVTVEADSKAAAEAALNSVLNSATPEVTALSSPYAVKVLWPPTGSAMQVPLPSGSQVAAAGALGGLFLGAGIGGLAFRSRRRPAVKPSSTPAGSADEEALSRL